MSQSEARQKRRLCARQGHVPKHGAPGEFYCARCLKDLSNDKGLPHDR